VSKRLQHIFVFVFIFSVFSLTLQASILNACKVSKVLKQNQQNPVTEEEEESHDEAADEEVLYLGNHQVGLFPVKHIRLSWANLSINYPTNSAKILIPPPER
jgi:hypothetical protein